MNELMANRPNEISPQLETIPQREDHIDLHALLGVLNDHRNFILIGTALFFLASVLYVFMATPRYQASAMVQVEGASSSSIGQPTAGQAADIAGSRAVTEIPLLTSRSALGEAVENLNLDIQAEPQRFPLIGEFIAGRYTPEQPGAVAPPLLGLDRYGWGGEELEILLLDVPEALLGQPLVLVAGEGGRYTLLDEDERVLLRGQVGQLVNGDGVAMKIGKLDANPGTHFDVVRNSYIGAIARLSENIDAVERGEDSGIIALTYQNADPELAAQVLGQISGSYLRQSVQRNSAEAENRLEFVNEQLPKVRADLERAQDALNEFQQRVGTVDISMQTEALLSQTVALNASIQQLRVQQPDVARRFTPAHPAYQSLQKQIGQLEAEKAALQSRMNELPDIQQGLYRLTRDVEVTNRTYTNLLDQAQQLDIARASAIGNVQVIDAPAVNVAKPVWPQPVPVIGGVTALGAMMLIAFVLTRQVLNRGVEDPEDIEQLGLPVYASIFLSSQERANALRPQRRPANRPKLLAFSAPSDLAMEALRGLRTSLHFARVEPKNNLLMIAGPSAGVGKTFVSSNLAVTTAQAGQRVLLIDADMRRGTLHEVLGTRWEDGLSELISGQIPLEAAIRRVRGTENLFFISRGKVPPNPSELLMHPDFAALLQEIAPLYDLVIIDTPPVLAVTDAAVIGHHVGTTLLVVRFGVNQAREVALAKQRLEQNGVKVKGAIVNAVQRRSAGHYSYSYSYYDSRPTGS